MWHCLSLCVGPALVEARELVELTRAAGGDPRASPSLAQLRARAGEVENVSYLVRFLMKALVALANGVRAGACLREERCRVWG